jgi:hypothetical protein
LLSHKRNKRSDALRLASEELLKALNLIVGLDQLLENLAAKLREMLDARTVYLVLHEPITNRYAGRMAKGERCDELGRFWRIPGQP